MYMKEKTVSSCSEKEGREPRRERPSADPARAMLLEELENFREITRVLMPSPGEIPQLAGLDIAGLSLPLRDICGGDHTIYVDFEKRFDLDARQAAALRHGRPDVARSLELNRQRAGILLADVSGHRITDAAIAAMLHQAFLLGCSYELEMHGEITTGLFERLKTRFHQSSAVNKFFTLIYTEVWSNGLIRCISAGHQPPYRFLPGDGILRPLRRGAGSTTPVGLFGSAADIDRARVPASGLRDEQFQVQESDPLLPGEMLLLCTDGLVEHDDGRFMETDLAPILAAAGAMPASGICELVGEAIKQAAPPEDDISLVVIRKVGAAAPSR